MVTRRPNVVRARRNQSGNRGSFVTCRCRCCLRFGDSVAQTIVLTPPHHAPQLLSGQVASTLTSLREHGRLDRLLRLLRLGDRGPQGREGVPLDRPPQRLGDILGDVGRLEPKSAPFTVAVEPHRVPTGLRVELRGDPAPAVHVVAARAMDHDSFAGEVDHEVHRLELEIGFGSCLDRDDVSTGSVIDGRDDSTPAVHIGDAQAVEKHALSHEVLREL